MDHGISISITSQSIGVKVSGGSNLPAPGAENDFIVANTGLNWIKKTLVEIRTILGLRSAAYTDSTDYAPIVHDHDGRYYTETEIDGMLGSISSKDFWSGTAAQYAALGVWDNNTLYFTTE